MKIQVIIPAHNEATSLAMVLKDIPNLPELSTIVVDNNSSDETAKIAQENGAQVVYEKKMGYGAACLAGLNEASKNSPDIYVFLDADYSDYPQDMEKILNELIAKDLDLVIGSRMLGESSKKALLPQARFGNWLATMLLNLRYGYRFSDLGPFRAVRAEALKKLNMKDQNFGWTMEMQVKALKYQLKVGEVSVRYRSRIGKSKITGTFKGTIMAGYKILLTLARYSF